MDIQGTVMNNIWRIWAKALGQKEGATDREADRIALVRSLIVGVNFITCLFIIAGIIRHW
jgi:hypothetical protein